MTDKPVCSIIIPSYRSAQTIGACLTMLLKQDFNQPYEIIVVDSSPDETPELIRRDFPQVQLIHLPQRMGPAMARNIGAQHAQGEILAFIDADCVPQPDWLRRLYEIIQQGYDGVGGAIANGNGQSLVSWAGYFCEFREFLPGTSGRDVLNLTLGNAAYRRTVFWSVGGLPTFCFPQEDQVFHRSLQGLGYRLRLDHGIVVAHTHRIERFAFLDHQRHIGRANAKVLCRLGLPGANLAEHPWLVAFLLPALVTWRFIRTIAACWRIERFLVFRRAGLLWLCWLGMCWWGQGFLEGLGARGPWTFIWRGLSYFYARD